MTTVDDPMSLDDALRIIRNVSELNNRDVPNLVELRPGVVIDTGVGLCPFCGGRGVMGCTLRDGYQNFRDDPDAVAYWVECVSCAAHGPWEKSVSAALRRWRTRVLVTPEPSLGKESSGEGAP